MNTGATKQYGREGEKKVYDKKQHELGFCQVEKGYECAYVGRGKGI
jgi:hypothetical protein